VEKLLSAGNKQLLVANYYRQRRYAQYCRGRTAHGSIDKGDITVHNTWEFVVLYTNFQVVLTKVIQLYTIPLYAMQI